MLKPFLSWGDNEAQEPTPGELAELWAERAAIKEYLANLPRKQAEEEAFLEIYGETEA